MIVHYQVIVKMICNYAKENKRAMDVIRSIKLSAVHNLEDLLFLWSSSAALPVLGRSHSKMHFILSSSSKCWQNIFFLSLIIMNIGCYIYKIPGSTHAY